MTVGRICVRDVNLAETGEPVQVAARRMNDRNVGSLVVLDAEKKPVGIVSDRDLTVRVLASGLDPAKTTVAEVMTKCPQTLREDSSIESALSLMRSGVFRRVLVVDEQGKLAGLLSLDDILDLLAEEFGEIRVLLKRESPQSLAAAP